MARRPRARSGCLFFGAELLDKVQKSNRQCWLKTPAVSALRTDIRDVLGMVSIPLQLP